MTRSELIAALRAATGPDRELDAEIAALVRFVPSTAPRWLTEWGGSFKPAPDVHSGVVAAFGDSGNLAVWWEAPKYTGSIDAAMTLLPDELWWLFGKGKTSEDEPLYGVRLFNPNDCEYAIAEAEHAASSVIALCVAALEAMG